MDGGGSLCRGRIGRWVHAFVKQWNTCSVFTVKAKFSPALTLLNCTAM